MPVTTVGVLDMSFESGQAEVIDQHFKFQWAETDEISCLSCEWEGQLLQAKSILPSRILAKLDRVLEFLDVDSPKEQEMINTLREEVKMATKVSEEMEEATASKKD